MTDSDQVRDRFWEDLEQVRTGLLTIDGTHHAMPMTAHWRGRDMLYFFAPADGVLAGEVGDDTPGEFLYTGPRHALYAVIPLALRRVDDRDVRGQLWSDEVEAWFPGGPDGDAAVLVGGALGDARVWLADESRPGHDERAEVALGGGGFREGRFGR